MPAIAKFYSGRSVFITGGSGFIGKQIIEKLLRSCPEVENIYVLMRAKKGQAVNRRLDQTLMSPVFGRLRQLQPQFDRKIIPVVGDVSQEFLGISDVDRRRLESNVSVAIHSAATLNFMEPLRDAVNMNILGVKRMLNVCKEIPKLESLVHISTGYSQVDKKDLIEEKLYDPPLSPEKIISLTKTLTDDELSVLTSHLLKIHDRPNTYTLTKAIAERLIAEEHGNIPCCIVRPTIVAASYKEPFPGWLDNYTAANGVYIGYGTGMIRAVLTQNGTQLDIVPVDMTANSIIAAGWHTAINRNAANNVQIYNLTAVGLKPSYPTTVEGTAVRMMKMITKSPYSILPVRRAITGLAPSTYNTALYRFWSEVHIPLRCMSIDKLLSLTGKKPRMVRMHKQFKKLQDVLLYFTTNGFNWSNDNLLKLYNEMDSQDKQEFGFDFSSINLEEYYTEWWTGIKKYVLKDPAILKPDSAPEIQPVIKAKVGPTVQTDSIAKL